MQSSSSSQAVQFGETVLHLSDLILRGLSDAMFSPVKEVREAANNAYRLITLAEKVGGNAKKYHQLMKDGIYIVYCVHQKSEEIRRQRRDIPEMMKTQIIQLNQTLKQVLQKCEGSSKFSIRKTKGQQTTKELKRLMDRSMAMFNKFFTTELDALVHEYLIKDECNRTFGHRKVSAPASKEGRNSTNSSVREKDQHPSPESIASVTTYIPLATPPSDQVGSIPPSTTSTLESKGFSQPSLATPPLEGEPVSASRTPGYTAPSQTPPLSSPSNTNPIRSPNDASINQPLLKLGEGLDFQGDNNRNIYLSQNSNNIQGIDTAHIPQWMYKEWMDRRAHYGVHRSDFTG